MAEAMRDVHERADIPDSAGAIEVPRELLLQLLTETDLAARDLRLASLRRPDQSPLLERAERLQAVTESLKRRLGTDAVQGCRRSIYTVELPDIPNRSPSL